MIDNAPIFSVYAVRVRSYGDMFTRGGIKPSFTSVSRVTGINEANHRCRATAVGRKQWKPPPPWAATAVRRSVGMVNGSNPHGTINASVDHLNVDNTSGRGSPTSPSEWWTLCASARALYGILSRKIYQPRPFLLFNLLMCTFALHMKNVKKGHDLHPSLKLICCEYASESYTFE